MEKAGELSSPLIQLIRKEAAQLYQMPVNNRIKHLAWNSVSEQVFEAKHHPAASPSSDQVWARTKKTKVYLERLS